MAGRTDISALSITDGKISNQAKISPKKIAPAAEASFMIAQTDKKYQPKVIHGDGTIDANGKLTLSVATTSAATTDTVSFTDADRQKLDSIDEGATGKPTAEEVRELYESNVGVVQRFDKLDNQDGAFYTDVTNHTAGTAASLGTPTGSTGLSGFNTKQTVPKVVYTSDSEGGNSSADILIPHNFGYYPQVTVMSRTLIPDSDPVAYKYIECDVEVENETTQTKIHTSEQGLELKIVLS